LEQMRPAAVSGGADLAAVVEGARGYALDFFGGHVIAAGAAKHADFRMMLNARQLAHKYHRHVAVLANR
jgi:hypothetical protein